MILAGEAPAATTMCLEPSAILHLIIRSLGHLERIFAHPRFTRWTTQHGQAFDDLQAA